MQNNYLFLLVFLFCLLETSASPQLTVFDPVYGLNKVSLDTPKISGFKSGSKSTRLHFLTKATFSRRSLTDLSTDDSPFFIKSSALGLLATVSFRRGDAMPGAGINFKGGLPINAHQEIIDPNKSSSKQQFNFKK